MSYVPASVRHRWTPARLGQSNILKEIGGRLSELEEPLKFMGVSLGWIGGDLIAHELFETTKGARTPSTYYKNKLLLAPAFLIAGRIVSDLIGGSKLIRALTLGTTANLLMQAGYIMSYPPDFNLGVFLIHEVLVVPLSLLLVGRPGQVLFFKEGPG